MNKELLNIENKQENIGLYQQVCDKHEYVFVTLTTTLNDGTTTKEVKKNGWLQCKKCGHFIQNQTL